jgi:carbon-monoxide dehydrogenase medium subunit
MKPAAFEYHSPTTVEEVLTLLEEYPHAELMAGNQSLGIVMANRLATPDHVVDLNGVDELRGIERRGDDVTVGAMTTHRSIERSDTLAETLPLLPDSAGQIAGPSVRNRGTVGGSIGEADPAGNYPAALLALEGEIVLQSGEDTRTVPAADYFIAYMFTDRREDELITGVTVPTGAFPADRTGMSFDELKPTSQTWPTVSTATAVRVDDPAAADPVVEEARVALANAADIPVRVEAAEAAVEGTTLDDAALEAAGEAAIDAADPEAEMHADREFKLEVVGEYTRRSLRHSLEGAVGGGA